VRSNISPRSVQNPKIPGRDDAEIIRYLISRYKLRAATCLTITATAAAEPLTEDYHSGDDLKGFLDAKSVKSHAISD
jgi:hypothetical protein